MAYTRSDSIRRRTACCSTAASLILALRLTATVVLPWVWLELPRGRGKFPEIGDSQHFAFSVPVLDRGIPRNIFPAATLGMALYSTYCIALLEAGGLSKSHCLRQRVNRRLRWLIGVKKVHDRGRATIGETADGRTVGCALIVGS